MISLLIVSLQAAILQGGHQALLVTAAEQVEDVRWAETPSADQIAATPPAQMPGSGRAALKCTADKVGGVVGCEKIAAEPNDREVEQAALNLSPLYRLNAEGTERVKWSKAPPVIWMQTYFPDENGQTPGDCSPAFGCIVEPPPPPPQR